jgi:hypothetical protein
MAASVAHGGNSLAHFVASKFRLRFQQFAWSPAALPQYFHGILSPSYSNPHGLATV